MTTMTIMISSMRITENTILMIMTMAESLMMISILISIAIAVFNVPSASFSHKIPLRRLKNPSSRRFDLPHGQTWRLFSMD